REEVFRALESRPAGLTHSEAGQRQARFGPNVIDEVRGHHLLKQVARQFIHLFALLLWAGSALAVLVGQTNLAAAIVAVIMINGAFGLWQEHRAEATVAALKKLLPDAATVIREGSEVRLAAAQLVPGDLVLLAEGDRLSADARLVQALDLRLDESTLTGESHPVYKTDLPVPDTNEPLLQAHNMVFAGTIVVAGSGQAVVASTGMRREFGRIAQLTATVHQGPSPLELEAGSVARRVALLSVAMGGLFFAIGHLFA